MNENDIKKAVIEVLRDVAPEVDADKIDPKVNFRDQFDFDSMDYLNFGLGLEKRLGVKIPDTDYPRLSSLAGCVTYLSARSLSARSGASG